ncbi:hypothetical protein RJT34_28583 [Clitoria ternatea]|uniref:Uncharacterized protein n=1 Tax=Clitoria ternatea TaxID=43366 RepID=A0AAN9IBL5_CLITE
MNGVVEANLCKIKVAFTLSKSLLAFGPTLSPDKIPVPNYTIFADKEAMYEDMYFVSKFPVCVTVVCLVF